MKITLSKSYHRPDSFRRKFDYQAYRMASHLPQKLKPYYYGINAFFLEVLKSREISRERSIA